mgnify:CR=1 FL=1
MNPYICQDLDVKFEDVEVVNVLLHQIVNLLVTIVLQMKSLRNMLTFLRSNSDKCFNNVGLLVPC